MVLVEAEVMEMVNWNIKKNLWTGVKGLVVSIIAGIITPPTKSTNFGRKYRGVNIRAISFRKMGQ